MNKLIEARKAYNAAVERMNAAVEAIEAADAAIEAEALTALQTEFDEAHAEVERSKSTVESFERLAEARSLHPLADVTTVDDDNSAEERTAPKRPVYAKSVGQRSWFGDLYAAQNLGDGEARARLARANDEHRKAIGSESRAVLSSDGAANGAAFVPPKYIVDQFVELARSGRVLADLIKSPASLEDVAPYGTTVSLPKLTVGASTGEQALQSDDITDSDVDTDSATGTVRTIAGKVDLSRVVFSRSAPGLDEILTADIARDYNQKVNARVITDLLGHADRNTVTYTDASPTVGELYPHFGMGKSQIHSGIQLPADVMVMHPRRWEWICSQVDSNGRPFVVPAGQGPSNALATSAGVSPEGYAGSAAGLPVYIDGGFRTNQGSSTNEDEILIVALPAADLFEEAAGPQQFAFQEVLSGKNQIRLMLTGFICVLVRNGEGLAEIAGTGLVGPSGY